MLSFKAANGRQTTIYAEEEWSQFKFSTLEGSVAGGYGDWQLVSGDQLPTDVKDEIIGKTLGRISADQWFLCVYDCLTPAQDWWTLPNGLKRLLEAHAKTKVTQLQFKLRQLLGCTQ